MLLFAFIDYVIHDVRLLILFVYSNLLYRLSRESLDMAKYKRYNCKHLINIKGQRMQFYESDKEKRTS